MWTELEGSSSESRITAYLRKIEHEAHLNPASIVAQESFSPRKAFAQYVKGNGLE